jgi:hypothetical protein
VKRLTHPATVIAAFALFVALGGTAAWASGLISGSQIKNHSIAENKLTKKAIKALHGQQGPRGATGLAGPPGPGGGSSSNLMRWSASTGVRDVVGDSGGPDLSNLSDRTGIVTLATVGTLKVDGICWDDGVNTYAATFIETTQDSASSEGSFGQTPLNVADGPVEVSQDIADNASASDSFFGPDDGSWAAMNAAGTVAIDGFANQAVPNLSGGANAQCLFSGFLVQVAG